MFKNHDYYNFLSKQYNVRARSWFKLQEIDKKFNLIKNNNLILEIGCSPGSWTQYIINICKIISIDILDMKSIKNCFFIKSNLIKHNIFFKFKQILCLIKFDLIISDACQNITGLNTIDDNKTIEIINLNITICNYFLKNKKNLLIKVFNSNKLIYDLKYLNNKFNKFYLFKPKSSKKKSKEIFAIFIQKI